MCDRGKPPGGGESDDREAFLRTQLMKDLLSSTNDFVVAYTAAFNVELATGEDEGKDVSVEDVVLQRFQAFVPELAEFCTKQLQRLKAVRSIETPSQGTPRAFSPTAESDVPLSSSLVLKLAESALSAHETRRPNESNASTPLEEEVRIVPRATISSGHATPKSGSSHLNTPRSVELGRSNLSHSTKSMAGAVSVRLVSGTTYENDEGNQILGDYELVTELGRGSCGMVQLAVHTQTGEPVAIKTMFRKTVSRTLPQQHGEEGRESLSASMASDTSHRSACSAPTAAEREIALMKKLRHKHLVRLYAVIQDEEEEQCHLVMQYIDDGPIGQVKRDGTCKPLPLMDVVKYVLQIAAALQYLHQHGILHRDLKPENILVDTSGNAYIADFGVSSVMEDTRLSAGTTQGTLSFFSPEMCADVRNIQTWGKEADIWALGVTMYVLLYGHLPFHGYSHLALIGSIMNDKLTFEENASTGALPEAIKTILTKSLDKNPKTRITLSALRRELKAFLQTGAKTETDSQLPKELGDEDDDAHVGKIVVNDDELADSVLRRTAPSRNSQKSPRGKAARRETIALAMSQRGRHVFASSEDTPIGASALKTPKMARREARSPTRTRAPSVTVDDPLNGSSDDGGSVEQQVKFASPAARMVRNRRSLQVEAEPAAAEEWYEV